MDKLNIISYITISVSCHCFANSNCLFGFHGYCGHSTDISAECHPSLSADCLEQRLSTYQV